MKIVYYFIRKLKPFMGKITEPAIDEMLSLKEQYKPILDRAKQIKAAKH